MLTSLGRLLALLLWVPLIVCKPVLRALHRQRRRRGELRVRPPAAAGRGGKSGKGASDTRRTASATARNRTSVPTRKAPASPVAPPAPSPAPRDRLDEMRSELGRILDADVTHRRTYKHLARFERKFGETGLRTLELIPVADLRRALRDFEALVRNWSSAPLAELRSRMAVVLADRSSAASVWIAANSVSSVIRPGG